MIKNLIKYIILLSFLQCSKEGDYERPYPVVSTLQASDISESGVLFSAEVINKDNIPIIEHGFIWDTKGSHQILIKTSNRKYLNGNINDNMFSAIINSVLYKNKIQRFRAFIRTNDYLVYGQELTFLSKGCKPPIFSDFEPKYGKIGDTIVLKGKRFSFLSNNNRVVFNRTIAKIIKSTDTTLVCIVPKNIQGDEFLIHLSVANNTTVSKEKFSLKEVGITSITPIEGTFGDELTIKGKYFGKNNKVFFGNVRAQVIFIDDKTIKIIVPDEIASRSEKIKIVSDKREDVYSKNFSLLPPKIISITDLFSNREVTIKVKNYHPDRAKNKFFIENLPVKILSSDNSNFVVKVPIGPFPRRKVKIKIEMLDLISIYESDIKVLDKWVMVSNELPFYSTINNAVIVNDEVYVVSRKKADNNLDYYLWKFNSLDYTWKKVLLIPFKIKSSAVISSNGHNIFIYAKEKGFWKLVPETKKLIQQSPFPGKIRDYPTHFSIDENIYLGMGANLELDESYTDFYRYSPTTNTWEEILKFPSSNNFMRIRTSTFVIDNVAYIGNGASNTGDDDFWSYNPITNEWKRIANFIDARSYTSSFELNGKGYVTGGDTNECWRYDPILNKWTQIESIGKVRGNHFSFSLNGKGYLGGGKENGDRDSFDFYEFIP